MQSHFLDKYTGISEEFLYDELEDKLTVVRTQDAEPYLEDNKAQALEADNNWKGDMHKVATIPNLILEKWFKEEGINVFRNNKEDQRLLRKKLNDPDNRFLRTKLGKL